MPSNPEELRLKYKVLSNYWLMGQLRQPGRHLFSDLDINTFADFLDVLLSEKNFVAHPRTSARLGSSAQTGYCAWATNSNSERRLCDLFGKRVSRSREHSGVRTTMHLIGSRTF